MKYVLDSSAGVALGKPPILAVIKAPPAMQKKLKALPLQIQFASVMFTQ